MHIPSYVAFLLALFAIGTAFAVWKGDTAARIAGAVNFADVVGVLAIQMVTGAQAGEAFQLTTDFAWAVGLLLLAVRYASRWLGVTMFLQAVQFSLHAYYLVLDLPKDRLHAWVNNSDNLGILICICVGAALAIRRRMTLRTEEAELAERRRAVAARPLTQSAA